jgi:hypothetical protein
MPLINIPKNPSLKVFDPLQPSSTGLRLISSTSKHTQPPASTLISGERDGEETKKERLFMVQQLVKINPLIKYIR